MRRELEKRLERLSDGPQLRMVIAPPGVTDTREWWREHCGADPYCVVIAYADAKL